MDNQQVPEPYTFATYYPNPWVCPCCGKSLMYRDAIDAVHAIFRHIGHRFDIVSTYRCPAHQRTLPGPHTGGHTAGLAIDIKPCDLPLPQLIYCALSETQWANGIFGWYPDRGTIHLEIADRPACFCLTPKGYVDLWTTWHTRYPMNPLPKVPSTLRVPSPARFAPVSQQPPDSP